MNKAPNIVLVGAGQLGSRYLQGLALKINEANIQVIDPSKDSLLRAETRLSEISSQSSKFIVGFQQNYDSLFTDIDLCIIATTADCRLQVLREVLDRSKVKKMILEKILFQNLNEYSIATNLIEGSEIKAWVNCSRREFQIYKRVKAIFKSDPPLFFHLRGHEWGLACNSVHFLDIMNYLTESILTSIDSSGLSPELIPSKRKNFFEATGTIEGLYANGSIIRLESNSNIDFSFLITIQSRKTTVIIDEQKGLLLIKEKDLDWRTEYYEIPLLSQYIGIVVDQLLNFGTCQLPSFEVSTAIHIPFIKSLCDFYGITTCNIT